MLRKPTGKMEKSEPQMGSHYSVFPVGFISNLFHIYHFHFCSFRSSWLIILKFAKSTLMFNHQFLLRHLHFLYYHTLSLPCLTNVCSFLLYILSALALGDLKDHCCYLGEEQMCECLCNFHIFLSTVQF